MLQPQLLVVGVTFFMNPPSGQIHPDTAWYCVRSQPKREVLAALHLQDRLGISAYCPRLKVKKATPRGPVWFHEALFPGYFFAKFHLESQGESVRHSMGVSTLVHFGDHCPPVSEDAVNALMEEFPNDAPVLIENQYAIGDHVEFKNGPFQGLTGQIKACLSGGERVQVLLNFLGSVSSVEAEPWMLASGN